MKLLEGCWGRFSDLHSGQVTPWAWGNVASHNIIDQFSLDCFYATSNLPWVQTHWTFFEPRSEPHHYWTWTWSNLRRTWTSCPKISSTCSSFLPLLVISALVLCTKKLLKDSASKNIVIILGTVGWALCPRQRRTKQRRLQRGKKEIHRVVYDPQQIQIQYKSISCASALCAQR